MNNIYDFPAIMSDGRSNSDWTPSAVLSEQLRKRENITTNSEYRAYLQKNAGSIMAFNASMAGQQTGGPSTGTPK